MARKIKDRSVSLGSDHRGVQLKNIIHAYMFPDTDEEPTKFNISVLHDVGAYDTKSVDYPDIVKLVADETSTLISIFEFFIYSAASCSSY